MKKSILTVLMAAVAVSCCACGKTGNVEGTQNVPETQEVTERATEEESTAPETEEAEPEQHTSEGLVTETAVNHMTLLTPEGEFLFIGYPDAGVETDLEGGIQLGSIVKVDYTGSSENGDAVAVKVAAGNIRTDIPREAYAFAIAAVDAIKFMDQEGFADMMAYPVYLEPEENAGVTVKSKEGFMSIDREKIFTGDLMMLGDYNFLNMVHAEAGYIVGDGTPNFIFEETENGFGITGVNAVKE